MNPLQRLGWCLMLMRIACFAELLHVGGIAGLLVGVALGIMCWLDGVRDGERRSGRA